MRLVLIGQAAFGAQVLERLVKEGEQVLLTVTPAGLVGDPVTKVADTYEIPTLRPNKIRSPAVYQKIKELEVDLGVMAFVTEIVPSILLRLPQYGTIQYHPSLLPRHRGASAINWAIIRGEAKTGLTIFYPDEGIDTGPILLQKEVTIEPDDTVGSLYFRKLFPLGVEAITEAIELVKNGKALKLIQDESKATYEEPCGEKHAHIDWEKPLSEVYNLIRGTNPQPGAYTYYNRGKKLKIFDSLKEEVNTKHPPGVVAEITDECFAISVKGGLIKVLRVQCGSTEKISAGEFIKQSNISVGDIFDDNKSYHY